MKDRRACLMKPAGAVGWLDHGQSGISKQLDAVAGHKLLASIAKSLAKAERQLAEYAVMVLRNGPLEREEREQIRVVYPARFELFAATEMIENLHQAPGGARQRPARPRTPSARSSRRSSARRSSG